MPQTVTRPTLQSLYEQHTAQLAEEAAARTEAMRELYGNDDFLDDIRQDAENERVGEWRDAEGN